MSNKEDMNILGAIKEEWQQIPLSFRYVLISSILLISNSWILDHWRPNNTLPFLFWGLWDIRMISYSTGLTLFLITVVFFLIKRFFNLGSIVKRYKKRYPISDLEITYNLVWFSGKLILFDKRKKKYYHIYPWQTAEDLEFVSYGSHVEDRFPNPKDKIVSLENGEKLDTSEYSNGGSINTQK